LISNYRRENKVFFGQRLALARFIFYIFLGKELAGRETSGDNTGPVPMFSAGERNSW
jgi:hypothetical protein